MKTWYITREAGALQHRGVKVPEGKKIYLTEEQAKLHGAKVKKSDAPPANKDEVGVASEFLIVPISEPKQIEESEEKQESKKQIREARRAAKQAEKEEAKQQRIRDKEVIKAIKEVDY